MLPRGRAIGNAGGASLFEGAHLLLTCALAPPLHRARASRPLPSYPLRLSPRLSIPCPLPTPLVAPLHSLTFAFVVSQLCAIASTIDLRWRSMEHAQ